MTGKTASGFAEVINGASTGWASTQYLASSASGLPAIIGTRVATAALDIRTTSGADSKTVAEVKKGTILSVTGATAERSRPDHLQEQDPLGHREVPGQPGDEPAGAARTCPRSPAPATRRPT